MALSLKQTASTQQSQFSVGEVVKIRGRSTSHKILYFSDDGAFAHITWAQDSTWWPVSGFASEFQLDLFHEQSDKNCHKNGFTGLAVLVTPPLSLTGETHAS